MTAKPSRLCWSTLVLSETSKDRNFNNSTEAHGLGPWVAPHKHTTMGYEDRTYYRDDQGRGGGMFGGPGAPGGFGGRLAGATVVTWLLGLNVVIFLVDSVLTGSVRGDALSPYAWGSFSIDKGVFGLQVWRFFTYQFLHANFFHILFNMIGLFFFGPLIERWLGSRRFLAFYLLCGISGAVLYTLLAFVPGLIPGSLARPMVGASGSVYGILVACAVLFPHQRVMLLIPPIPMSMRTLALIFLGLAALSVIAGSSNAGGEAAHLGGALLGFILIKKPALIGWADRAAQVTQAFKGGDPAAREAKRVRRQKESQAAEQQQVDRILDKVRQHGMQSLTGKEKKALQRATERSNRS